LANQNNEIQILKNVPQGNTSLHRCRYLFSSSHQLEKIMRYPNTRYGNPVEFQYYTQGQPADEIAKRLKRDKRTVQRWLNGKQKMPWWIPEILRLQRLE
jgi:hypothetical protein